MSSVYDKKSARNRIIALAILCALVLVGIVTVFCNYYKDTNSLFSDVNFAKAIAYAATTSNKIEDAEHYEKVNTVDVDRKMLDEITGIIVTVNAVDQEGSYAPVVILAKEKYTDYYIKQNYSSYEKDEEDDKEDEESADSGEVSEAVSAEVSEEVSAEASEEVSSEVSEAVSDDAGASAEGSDVKTPEEESTPTDYYYVVYNFQDISDLGLFRNLRLIDMSGYNTRSLHQQLQFQYYQTAMQGANENTNQYSRPLATFKDPSVTDMEDLTDLSVFSDLSKLEYLCLGYSGLKTLDGIDQAKNLRFAELSHCKLNDVSALNRLSGITALNLSGNKLNSLEGISASSGMKLLQLNDCGLTSLEGLGGLTKLKSLEVSGNPLASLKGIEDSKVSLKEFSAQSCADAKAEPPEDESMDEEQKKEEQKKARTLVDASALEGFTKLETLDLSGNKLSDIGFLASLEGLKTVTLNDNEIKAVPEDLSKLSKLENFSAVDNRIKNPGGLKDAAALKQLTLDRNSLVTLKGLGNLKALTELSATENKKLDDLGDLGGASELTKLNLSGGRIRDIAQIKQLKNLSSINLSKNSINSLAALSDPESSSVSLAKVTTVNFSDNPDLTSLDSLAGTFDKEKLTSANFSIDGGENANIKDWTPAFAFTKAEISGMPASVKEEFDKIKNPGESSEDASGESSEEVSSEDASGESSEEVSGESSEDVSSEDVPGESSEAMSEEVSENSAA